MDFRKRKILIDQITTALRDCRNCPERHHITPRLDGEAWRGRLLPWMWRPAELAECRGAMTIRLQRQG